MLFYRSSRSMHQQEVELASYFVTECVCSYQIRYRGARSPLPVGFQSSNFKVSSDLEKCTPMFSFLFVRRAKVVESRLVCFFNVTFMFGSQPWHSKFFPFFAEEIRVFGHFTESSVVMQKANKTNGSLCTISPNALSPPPPASKGSSPECSYSRGN